MCNSQSLSHLASWFWFLASFPFGPSHLYKHHNNNYPVSGDLNILDIRTPNKYRTFHKGLAWLSRSGSAWHIPCVPESRHSLRLLFYGNGHPTNSWTGNKTLACFARGTSEGLPKVQNLWNILNIIWRMSHGARPLSSFQARQRCDPRAPPQLKGDWNSSSRSQESGCDTPSWGKGRRTAEWSSLW